MIEAKNLTKKYGRFTAVRKASFTVNQGEVVGLLGPNGAGKTTIMRMLTGFTPPTTGTAIIAGFDVTVDSLDAREHVGYLPERVPLYPDMTVFEYVNYWGQLRGMRNRKQRIERVDAVIKNVQLEAKRNKLVRSLSKGMRQRLGLAQALVHDPDIVILDEPTIGIDPQQVIEVRETVRNLGTAHAVLFSTHILTEAEQVCDRLVIINQGRIVAQGTPDELRRHLQQGAAIYIEFRETPPDAIHLINNTPGVVDVQPDGHGFNLQITDDTTRDTLFQRVVEAGHILREIRPISLTLEDIFINIVQDRSS